MARSKDGRKVTKTEQPFGLKELAEYLGLAPATVSLVMNGSSVAKTIAPETKKLIFEAARRFNYKPNFFARCLRTRRSFTIGVMVPEVSEGYNVSVLSGIEDDLLQEGYFYFVASHRFRDDLIEEYTQLFLHRSVDGLIVVCTPWSRSLPFPVATISSHHNVKGVNRIVLNHDRAAELALQHLTELGHRRIAFIKGQTFVPDTEIRWNAITKVAAKMGLSISSKLVTQIEENSPSPQLGYKATQELLVSGEPFTALFTFNDICAMGAIRALHEFGLRVPQDVSVLGFDDIESAAYQTSGLTTVRQPLRDMGKTAAQIVLRRILSGKGESETTPAQILFEPELVVRETTAIARQQSKPGSRPKLLHSEGRH
jgi:DNA-binding LacI/PurR family transcriptional regulator